MQDAFPREENAASTMSMGARMGQRYAAAARTGSVPSDSGLSCRAASCTALTSTAPSSRPSPACRRTACMVCRPNIADGTTQSLISVSRAPEMAFEKGKR